MRKILSFFVLLFLVIPSFAVEVATYEELQNAINSDQEEVLLSDDITFGSTSLIADKNINLTTVLGSTHTIQGSTVTPMIEFQGANSTISNITFSSVTSSTSVNPAIYVNVGTVGTGETYSTFTIKDVNFENNISNTNNGTGGALHINSQQRTYITDTVFSTNSALGTGAKGGAVYYEGGGDFSGRNLIFVENIAASDGGAMYASTVTLTADQNVLQDLIVGNVFSSNTSISGNGGAMYASTAKLSSTAFWANTALAGNGGALYASSATITGQGTLFSALLGDFTGNYADGNGGAIYVENYISAKEAAFLLNYSTNTASGKGMGGAIYAAAGSDANLSTTYFLGNSANKGGAVYSAGNLGIEDSLFGANESISDGGAIYAQGTTKIKDTSFEENIAGGNGGAIYLDNATLDLNGSVNFINNISSGTGGAIYANNGTININTSGKNITFQGNKDGAASTERDNDIVLNGSSTLNISGGGAIDFYGGVEGGSITSTDTVLNWHTASAYDGTLNITGGALSLLAPDTTLGNVTLNDTVINMQNGVADTVTVSSLNITGDIPIYIDADLANDTADTFTSVTGSGNLTIDSYEQLNILSDSSSNPTITFTGANVTVNENEDYYGPLYIYNVSSTSSDSFQVIRTNRTNPLISSLPIAANAKVLGNLHTTASLYNRIDVMFSKDRLNYRRPDNPQERFSGPQVDEKNPIKEDRVPTQSEHHMAWFIPNAAYQKVDFGNGIDDVRNILYGGVIGIDFPFLMSEETYLVPTFFAGYLGSKQEYQSASVNNDSLAVGGMLTLKNYVALLSAQMYITNGPESYTFKTYKGSFDVFSYTASVKGELDLDMSESLVFQPAVTLFYNMTGIQNYNTVNGASINSDRFHNVIVVPSVKFMASVRGWYPYLSASANINTLQRGKVTAEDMTIAKYKIKNYAEVSLGIENTFFKDYSGYFQVSGYAGGVRGVSFQLGLRGYID